MSNNPYKTHVTSGTAPPAPEPNEPPPPYSGTGTGSGHARNPSATLDVPTSPNRPSSVYSSDGDSDLGIPSNERASMEEEMRELPKGWIRQIDPATEHTFYVDTTQTPPRSSWVHPYDDPEYLSKLPDTDPAVQWQREHEQQQGVGSSTKNGKDEKRTFGRKLKDKLTGSTHEEREAQRAKEKELAQKQHALFLQRRREMLEAQRSGRLVYAAPAGGYPGMYGNQYGYRRGGGYGYGGYGRGGMGMGVPLMGGLLGGALLGGALGGGF